MAKCLPVTDELVTEAQDVGQWILTSTLIWELTNICRMLWYWVSTISCFFEGAQVSDCYIVPIAPQSFACLLGFKILLLVVPGLNLLPVF